MTLIDRIMAKLSFVQPLPGQGVFGSEPARELDFVVSLYAKDVEDHGSDSEMDRHVDDLVAEYVDCIERQYTMTLESDGFARGAFADETDLYAAMRGARNVVIGVKMCEMIRREPGFSPMKKRYAKKRIYCAGLLGRSAVYVNQYVNDREAYAIDRSVIDVRYEIVENRDDGRIDIMVKTKTNGGNADKYLLIA